jgi:hypothetical protein
MTPTCPRNSKSAWFQEHTPLSRIKPLPAHAHLLRLALAFQKLANRGYGLFVQRWPAESVNSLDVEVCDQARPFTRRKDAVDMNGEARVDARTHDLAPDTAKRDLRQSATGKGIRHVVLKGTEILKPSIE